MQHLSGKYPQLHPHRSEEDPRIEELLDLRAVDVSMPCCAVHSYLEDQKLLAGAPLSVQLMIQYCNQKFQVNLPHDETAIRLCRPGARLACPGSQMHMHDHAGRLLQVTAQSEELQAREPGCASDEGKAIVVNAELVVDFSVNAYVSELFHVVELCSGFRADSPTHFEY